jgi:hypothetical protein
MRSAKSGRRPVAFSSSQDKGPVQKPPSDVPTWPRFDLFPPEHVISGLRGWGSEVVLKSGDLNAADFNAVKVAVKRLITAEPELHALVSQVNDVDLNRKLLELVGGIAGAAYVIGAHGAMTDTAHVFFGRSRATHMRVSRATGAEEEKLRTAIEAVATANGITIPSGNAYKDAGRILSDVNKRLSALGTKSVSVDVIYRRLRPRS